MASDEAILNEMQVRAVPMLDDTYGWLLFDEESDRAVVVDPGEASPVIKLVRGFGLNVAAVLVTNHRATRTGGLRHLLSDVGGDVVVMGSRADHTQVAGLNRIVEDGERIAMFGHEMVCMAVPGYTRGAMAYFWPTLGTVFTGDTLVLAGCGSLLEASPAEMRSSLERLAGLPTDTLVCCGHERTEENLRFAALVDPTNEAVHHRLARVSQARRAGLPTVPAPLSDELDTNPFLRTHTRAIKEATGETDEWMVLAELQRRRDLA